MAKTGFQSRRMTIVSLAATALVVTIDGRASADKPPQTYSPIPNSPSDIYVQGRFDSSGTYIPPHYAPKSKPVFHGYFDKNAEYKHGYFYKERPKTNPDDSNAPPN